MNTYDAIVADPPWLYPSPGGGPLQSSPTHRPHSFQNKLAGVGSEKRYGAMSMDALKEMDIKNIATSNSHLYLWFTNAFAVQAHDLARAWGFVPKTIVTWGKVKPNGKPSMKTGYYFRGATEHFLFCVRGSLKLHGDPIPTLFLSKRLRHSVKPEWFYQLVEDQPYQHKIELFSRRHRFGWDVWGNQVESSIRLPNTACTRPPIGVGGLCEIPLQSSMFADNSPATSGGG
jgi:N6-adenosine-specific RNA methylase IME4